MFVKFCGFTRKEDLLHAESLGIDAAGFIFCPSSKRNLSIIQAQSLVKVITSDILKKVGVFFGHTLDEILNIVNNVELDYLQVYDTSMFDELSKHSPLIRAYRIKSEQDMFNIDDCPEQDYLLLDSFHPTEAGGTGHSFDWRLLKNFKYLSKTLIAGGLREENIDLLLGTFSPFGIDLSSAIETEPGKKSVEKMDSFIKKLNSLTK